MKNSKSILFIFFISVLGILAIVGSTYLFYVNSKTSVPSKNIATEQPANSNTSSQNRVSSSTPSSEETKNEAFPVTKVLISGVSFGHGDTMEISWDGNTDDVGLVLMSSPEQSWVKYIGEEVNFKSKNSAEWTIPITFKPGSYYIQAQVGRSDVVVKSQVFTISSSTAVNPKIISVSPLPVRVGDIITINAENINPLGRYVGNGWFTHSHIFINLKNSLGQNSILWEGGSQGGDYPNGNQITATLKPLLCPISSVAAGCSKDQYVRILSGQYTLSISVDGRGTSQEVPITIISSPIYYE